VRVDQRLEPDTDDRSNVAQCAIDSRPLTRVQVSRSRSSSETKLAGEPLQRPRWNDRTQAMSEAGLDKAFVRATLASRHERLASA